MEPAFPIVIRLAGQPEGKGRPRSRIVSKPNAKPFVQTYTPGQTRKYEDQLRLAAQTVMGEANPVERSIALALTLTATMAIPSSFSKKKRAAAIAGELLPVTKPDFDNLAKTLDGLNKVVFADDAQVCFATIVKVYGEKPGMLIVIRRAQRPVAA